MHTSTGGSRGVFACMLASGWAELYGAVKRTSCFRGFWYASLKSALAFRLFFLRRHSSTLFEQFFLWGPASSFSSDHICIYYDGSFPLFFLDFFFLWLLLCARGVIDVCGVFLLVRLDHIITHQHTTALLLLELLLAFALSWNEKGINSMCRAVLCFYFPIASLI